MRIIINWGDNRISICLLQVRIIIICGFYIKKAVMPLSLLSFVFKLTCLYFEVWTIKIKGSSMMSYGNSFNNTSKSVSICCSYSFSAAHRLESISKISFLENFFLASCVGISFTTSYNLAKPGYNAA